MITPNPLLMHLQNINVRTRKTLLGWTVEVEKEKRHLLFLPRNIGYLL